MSRILVLYGTTDGQTTKIANFLGEALRGHGAAVDVVRAGEVHPDPAGYDAVIVAASIHAGGYQRAVVQWVRDHAEALRRRPAALLTVCLGILQREAGVYRDLLHIKQQFVTRTGWEPVRHAFVAGALKYTEYGFLKRLVMRWIASRAGGSTDTSRNHEYTDWGELSRFAQSFGREAGLRIEGPMVATGRPLRMRSATVAAHGSVPSALHPELLPRNDGAALGGGR